VRVRGRSGGALAALVVGLLAIAGCGGDDDGATRSEKLTTLNVGLIPIVGVGPVFLGEKKGFYRKEGLRIKPRFSVGGAEIVPSVMNGSLDIGYSNTVSLLIAAERGLPLRLLTGGVVGAPDREHAWAQIMVPKDGSIRTPADLAGKTIAVNTLKNVADTTTKESLAKHGVDPGSVKLLEVDFPDMPAALKAGRVDAIFEVEPFVTVAESQGARALLPPYVETSPSLPISNFFTTEQYIGKHRDVVERFVRATRRSLAYARDHPEEVRPLTADFTKIQPNVRQKMTLPSWNPDIDRDGIGLLDRLNIKYGLYRQPVDLDALVFD
jgi:NitT/TauT family transport system substrate-binding protein